MSSQRLQLRAASRLHFGLLAWGEEAPRQFGSVGLMVESPGLVVSARRASCWHVCGVNETRACKIVEHVVTELGRDYHDLSPLDIQIESATPEHIGLGTGTQLSLAITRLILSHAGEPHPSAQRLAQVTGRGRRSGIGLHGSIHGGLLVDGGRGRDTAYPPLLARHDFPENWSILVVIPPTRPGLSDAPEREAFARLPGISSARIDRLSRLVLLGLLPAVVEHDLGTFGDALTKLQYEVGVAFAPAQGGIYADVHAEEIVSSMKQRGLVGVGQSSWGPALYGFTDQDESQKVEMTMGIQGRFSLEPDSIYWTKAYNRGVQIDEINE